MTHTQLTLITGSVIFIFLAAAGIIGAVHNAIDRALLLVGFTPHGYDVDAVYGSLLQDGVHVVTSDDIEAQMFQDRCDFECSVCHPEDDQ